MRQEIQEAIGRIRQVSPEIEPKLDALCVVSELESTIKDNYRLKKLSKTIVKYLSECHDHDEDDELNKIESELIALTLAKPQQIRGNNMAEFEIEIECKTKSWTIFWDVEAETAKEAAETALEEICQDHIEVDQNDIILSVVKINGIPNLNINLKR